MKIVADEGVDRRVVGRLRQSGHQVWYVSEMEPGITDEAVLELANREGAVLLTADKDFGELVFRQERMVKGVILIRLAGISPDPQEVATRYVIGKIILFSFCFFTFAKIPGPL